MADAKYTGGRRSRPKNYTGVLLLPVVSPAIPNKRPGERLPRQRTVGLHVARQSYLALGAFRRVRKRPPMRQQELFSLSHETGRQQHPCRMKIRREQSPEQRIGKTHPPPPEELCKGK